MSFSAVRFLFLVALLLPASAYAASIDLTGTAGQTAATTGALTDAELGSMTFQAQPGGSQITWTAGYGLGIDCMNSWTCAGDEVDEIDTFEVLTTRFLNGPVLLNDVTLSQIWIEGPYGIIVEGGLILGNSFVLQFDAADDPVNDGWLTVDVGRQVEWVRITAAKGFSKDFSLAGFSATRGATPTPEPAATALFLGGFGVVAFSLRRAR